MHKTGIRIASLLLAMVMLFSAFPVAPAAKAANATNTTVYNSFIRASVNDKNGRFNIRTVNGQPVRKLDVNRSLTFDEDDTSFTTFRINGTDYIFGNKYNIKEKGIQSTFVPPVKSVDPSTFDQTITTVWGVEGVMITQIITVYDSQRVRDLSKAGMVQVNYDVRNTSGADVRLGTRILLDTMIGNNDGPAYQNGTISANTQRTERTLVRGVKVGDVVDGQKITADNKNYYDLKNYYVLRDDGDATDPLKTNIFAYGYHNFSDTENLVDRIIVGHWNHLANSKYNVDVNHNLDFTLDTNDYGTADSAIAYFWDNQVIAAKGSQNYQILYGLGEIVEKNQAFNITFPNQPSQLITNAEQTKYKDDGVFLLTVQVENPVDSGMYHSMIDCTLTLDKNLYFAAMENDEVVYIDGEPGVTGGSSRSSTYQKSLTSEEIAQRDLEIEETGSSKIGMFGPGDICTFQYYLVGVGKPWPTIREYMVEVTSSELKAKSLQASMEAQAAAEEAAAAGETNSPATLAADDPAAREVESVSRKDFILLPAVGELQQTASFSLSPTETYFEDRKLISVGVNNVEAYQAYSPAAGTKANFSAYIVDTATGTEYEVYPNALSVISKDGNTGTININYTGAKFVDGKTVGDLQSNPTLPLSSYQVKVVYTGTEDAEINERLSFTTTQAMRTTKNKEVKLRAGNYLTVAKRYVNFIDMQNGAAFAGSYGAVMQRMDSMAKQIDATRETYKYQDDRYPVYEVRLHENEEGIKEYEQQLNVYENPLGRTRKWKMGEEWDHGEILLTIKGNALEQDGNYVVEAGAEPIIINGVVYYEGKSLSIQIADFYKSVGGDTAALLKNEDSDKYMYATSIMKATTIKGDGKLYIAGSGFVFHYGEWSFDFYDGFEKSLWLQYIGTYDTVIDENGNIVETDKWAQIAEKYEDSEKSLRKQMANVDSQLESIATQLDSAPEVTDQLKAQNPDLVTQIEALQKKKEELEKKKEDLQKQLDKLPEDRQKEEAKLKEDEDYAFSTQTKKKTSAILDSTIKKYPRGIPAEQENPSDIIMEQDVFFNLQSLYSIHSLSCAGFSYRLADFALASYDNNMLLRIAGNLSLIIVNVDMKSLAFDSRGFWGIDSYAAFYLDTGVSLLEPIKKKFAEDVKKIQGKLTDLAKKGIISLGVSESVVNYAFEQLEKIDFSNLENLDADAMQKAVEKAVGDVVKENAQGIVRSVVKDIGGEVLPDDILNQALDIYDQMSKDGFDLDKMQANLTNIIQDAAEEFLVDALQDGLKYAGVDQSAIDYAMKMYGTYKDSDSLEDALQKIVGDTAADLLKYGADKVGIDTKYVDMIKDKYDQLSAAGWSEEALMKMGEELLVDAGKELIRLGANEIGLDSKYVENVFDQFDKYQSGEISLEQFAQNSILDSVGNLMNDVLPDNVMDVIGRERFSALLSNLKDVDFTNMSSDQLLNAVQGPLTDMAMEYGQKALSALNIDSDFMNGLMDGMRAFASGDNEAALRSIIKTTLQTAADEIIPGSLGNIEITDELINTAVSRMQDVIDNWDKLTASEIANKALEVVQYVLKEYVLTESNVKKVASMAGLNESTTNLIVRQCENLKSIDLTNLNADTATQFLASITDDVVNTFGGELSSVFGSEVTNILLDVYNSAGGINGISKFTDMTGEEMLDAIQGPLANVATNFIKDHLDDIGLDIPEVRELLDAVGAAASGDTDAALKQTLRTSIGFIADQIMSDGKRKLDELGLTDQVIDETYDKVKALNLDELSRSDIAKAALDILQQVLKSVLTEDRVKQIVSGIGISENVVSFAFEQLDKMQDFNLSDLVDADSDQLKEMAFQMCTNAADTVITNLLPLGLDYLGVGGDVKNITNAIIQGYQNLGGMDGISNLSSDDAADKMLNAFRGPVVDATKGYLKEGLKKLNLDSELTNGLLDSITDYAGGKITGEAALKSGMKLTLKKALNELGEAVMPGALDSLGLNDEAFDLAFDYLYEHFDLESLNEDTLPDAIKEAAKAALDKLLTKDNITKVAKMALDAANIKSDALDSIVDAMAGLVSGEISEEDALKATLKVGLKEALNCAADAISPGGLSKLGLTDEAFDYAFDELMKLDWKSLSDDNKSDAFEKVVKQALDKFLTADNMAKVAKWGLQQFDLDSDLTNALVDSVFGFVGGDEETMKSGLKVALTKAINLAGDQIMPGGLAKLGLTNDVFDYAFDQVMKLDWANMDTDKMSEAVESAVKAALDKYLTPANLAKVAKMTLDAFDVNNDVANDLLDSIAELGDISLTSEEGLKAGLKASLKVGLKKALDLAADEIVPGGLSKLGLTDDAFNTAFDKLMQINFDGLSEAQISDAVEKVAKEVLDKYLTPENIAKAAKWGLEQLDLDSDLTNTVIDGIVGFASGDEKALKDNLRVLLRKALDLAADGIVPGGLSKLGLTDEAFNYAFDKIMSVDWENLNSDQLADAVEKAVKDALDKYLTPANLAKVTKMTLNAFNVNNDIANDLLNSISELGDISLTSEEGLKAGLKASLKVGLKKALDLAADEIIPGGLSKLGLTDETFDYAFNKLMEVDWENLSTDKMTDAINDAVKAALDKYLTAENVSKVAKWGLEQFELDSDLTNTVIDGITGFASGNEEALKDSLRVLLRKGLDLAADEIVPGGLSKLGLTDEAFNYAFDQIMSVDWQNLSEDALSDVIENAVKSALDKYLTAENVSKVAKMGLNVLNIDSDLTNDLADSLAGFVSGEISPQSALKASLKVALKKALSLAADEIAPGGLGKLGLTDEAFDYAFNKLMEVDWENLSTDKMADAISDAVKEALDKYLTAENLSKVAKWGLEQFDLDSDLTNSVIDGIAGFASGDDAALKASLKTTLQATLNFAADSIMPGALDKLGLTDEAFDTAFNKLTDMGDLTKMSADDLYDAISNAVQSALDELLTAENLAKVAKMGLNVLNVDSDIANDMLDNFADYAKGELTGETLLKATLKTSLKTALKLAASELVSVNLEDLGLTDAMFNQALDKLMDVDNIANLSGDALSAAIENVVQETLDKLLTAENMGKVVKVGLNALNVNSGVADSVANGISGFISGDEEAFKTSLKPALKAALNLAAEQIVPGGLDKLNIGDKALDAAFDKLMELDIDTLGKMSADELSDAVSNAVQSALNQFLTAENLVKVTKMGLNVLNVDSDIANGMLDSFADYAQGEFTGETILKATLKTGLKTAFKLAASELVSVNLEDLGLTDAMFNQALDKLMDVDNIANLSGDALSAAIENVVRETLDKLLTAENMGKVVKVGLNALNVNSDVTETLANGISGFVSGDEEALKETLKPALKSALNLAAEQIVPGGLDKLNIGDKALDTAFNKLFSVDVDTLTGMSAEELFEAIDNAVQSALDELITAENLAAITRMGLNALNIDSDIANDVLDSFTDYANGDLTGETVLKATLKTSLKTAFKLAANELASVSLEELGFTETMLDGALDKLMEVENIASLSANDLSNAVESVVRETLDKLLTAENMTKVVTAGLNALNVNADVVNTVANGISGFVSGDEEALKETLKTALTTALKLASEQIVPGGLDALNLSDEAFDEAFKQLMKFDIDTLQNMTAAELSEAISNAAQSALDKVMTAETLGSLAKTALRTLNLDSSLTNTLADNLAGYASGELNGETALRATLQTSLKTVLKLAAEEVLSASLEELGLTDAMFNEALDKLMQVDNLANLSAKELSARINEVASETLDKLMTGNNAVKVLKAGINALNINSDMANIAVDGIAAFVSDDEEALKETLKPVMKSALKLAAEQVMPGGLDMLNLSDDAFDIAFTKLARVGNLTNMSADELSAAIDSAVRDALDEIFTADNLAKITKMGLQAVNLDSDLTNELVDNMAGYASGELNGETALRATMKTSLKTALKLAAEEILPASLQDLGLTDDMFNEALDKLMAVENLTNLTPDELSDAMNSIVKETLDKLMTGENMVKAVKTGLDMFNLDSDLANTALDSIGKLSSGELDRDAFKVVIKPTLTSALENAANALLPDSFSKLDLADQAFNLAFDKLMDIDNLSAMNTDTLTAKLNEIAQETLTALLNNTENLETLVTMAGVDTKTASILFSQYDTLENLDPVAESLKQSLTDTLLDALSATATQFLDSKLVPTGLKESLKDIGLNSSILDSVIEQYKELQAQGEMSEEELSAKLTDLAEDQLVTIAQKVMRNGLNSVGIDASAVSSVFGRYQRYRNGQLTQAQLSASVEETLRSTLQSAADGLLKDGLDALGLSDKALEVTFNNLLALGDLDFTDSNALMTAMKNLVGDSLMQTLNKDVLKSIASDIGINKAAIDFTMSQCGKVEAIAEDSVAYAKSMYEDGIKDQLEIVIRQALNEIAQEETIEQLDVDKIVETACSRLMEQNLTNLSGDALKEKLGEIIKSIRSETIVDSMSDLITNSMSSATVNESAVEQAISQYNTEKADKQIDDATAVANFKSNLRTVLEETLNETLQDGLGTQGLDMDKLDAAVQAYVNNTSDTDSQKLNVLTLSLTDIMKDTLNEGVTAPGVEATTIDSAFTDFDKYDDSDTMEDVVAASALSEEEIQALLGNDVSASDSANPTAGDNDSANPTAGDNDSANPTAGDDFAWQ